jgi:hypothetical protein
MEEVVVISIVAVLIAIIIIGFITAGSGPSQADYDRMYRHNREWAAAWYAYYTPVKPAVSEEKKEELR